MIIALRFSFALFVILSYILASAFGCAEGLLLLFKAPRERGTTRRDIRRGGRFALVDNAQTGSEGRASDYLVGSAWRKMNLA